VVYRAAVLSRGEHGVFRHLEELRRLSTRPREEILVRQRERLAGALQHAWHGSSLYRERWAERPPGSGTAAWAYLAELPMLEKVDLQARMDRIRSDPPPAGRVSRKTTGGSTGEAVTVEKDGEAIAREMASSWLAYGWFGVRIGDKAARFWGNPTSSRRKLRFIAADLAMNRIRFSAFAFDDGDLERYWGRCLAFRPDYFYGYVSMLVGFAHFLDRTGRDGSELGLKVVVTTSEVLSPEDEAVLRDTFGCPVQNEYGCGEVGPIAYACPEGPLHVMADNVLVEVVDESGRRVEPGEAGEILVTDLNNRAAPLIRYRVGDRAVLGTDVCPCGCGFPTLERVWGRAYDFIEAPDGRRYHGEYFMYVFEEMRDRGLPVEQFQVRQVEPSRLEISLLTREDIDGRAHFLRERVADEMPGMSVDVRSVEEIRRAPSGKMPLIINELE
jgi:phenylacetate-CoA ligase